MNNYNQIEETNTVLPYIYLYNQEEEFFEPYKFMDIAEISNELNIGTDSINSLGLAERYLKHNFTKLLFIEDTTFLNFEILSHYYDDDNYIHKFVIQIFDGETNKCKCCGNFARYCFSVNYDEENEVLFLDIGRCYEHQRKWDSEYVGKTLQYLKKTMLEDIFTFYN